MLTRYSYKGCMFECRLKNAIRNVSCAPWDYPMPPSMKSEGYLEFCNSSHAQGGGSTLSRFDDFMNSGDSISNCDCAPDCEAVVYESQVILEYK